MAKNYGKTSSKRRNTSKNHGNVPAGWKWLLLGLLIGLLIGAVFYLKQQSSGNLESGLKSILSDKAQPKHTTTVKTKLPKPTKQTVAQPEIPQPRFDFYTMLPKVEVPATKTARQHNVPPSKKPDTGKISTPNANTSMGAISNKLDIAVPKEPSAFEESITNKPSTQYILQIAALSHYKDADQLRAQLVLLGFDTHIKTVKSNGTTYNRVWLGPYASASEALNIQKRLQENKIKSVMVKAT